MTARILPPTPENLRLAAEAILRGEVVAMPTETVYGLAGNAFDEKALARIFATKERPTFDPLIVHVAGPRDLAELRIADLSRFTAAARARLDALLENFWPGPLTLVLPKYPDIPDLATSGLQTVAVRMPRHPAAQALLAACGVPLAAPSANRFGRISPTSAADVESELSDRIDLILDGGPCAVGVESTVLELGPTGMLTLLRPGGMPVARIEQATGAKVVVANARPGAGGESGASMPAAGALARVGQTSPGQVSPGQASPGQASPGQASPGMLDSHYAPAKPLRLLPGSVSALTEPQKSALRAIAGLPAGPVGLLAFQGDAGRAAAEFEKIIARPVLARVLSSTGDVEEAARHLFAELRALDASAAGALFAESCPVSTGLGHAIQDRLTRASLRK